MTYRATFDPGPEHDRTQGFFEKSEWLNTITRKLSRSDDDTKDAAVWVDITPGADNVVGPESVIDDRMALFDGTTGKLIKEGSKTGAEVAAHLDDVSGNPHDVTAAQAGADPVGSASAVQTNLNTHTGEVAKQREINDAGTGTTDLLSADKILAITSALVSGNIRKPGVDTTTTSLGNTTLSGEQTLNGVTTLLSFVLVTEQTLPAENGPYLTAAGAWTRATFADEDAEVSNGNLIDVINPAADEFQYKYLLVTPDPIVVGTTGQTWQGHRNIELGTTGGTAAEGNDSRIPTQDQNDALDGTDGTPATANPYVTDSDPRNTDARAPTAHNHSATELTSGVLADARVQESNVTQHEGAVDHNALANYEVGQHRVIDDGATSLTGLWSSTKIDTELGGKSGTGHTHDHADATGQTADDHHNQSHALAGGDHTAATLAELNAKVSDATLDDSGDARPPTAHTHAHASTTGQTADDHHPQSHTVASHSDTTATGAELETLTDGSNADALHVHATPTIAHSATTGQTADDHHDEAHTVASHTDTAATGAQLDTLTDGSEANGLHSHAPAQLFLWSFSTNTTAADPGSGNARMNNATPASVTAVYFSSIDGAGFDFDNFFASLLVGDRICVQQADDASKRIDFTVASALTDEAGWWTVPVTVVSSAGALFSNNKDTAWLINMRF